MKSWPKIDGALADYVDGNWLRDSPLKRRLREETAKMPGAGMQISAHQGQQIGLLTRVQDQALRGVLPGYRYFRTARQSISNSDYRSQRCLFVVSFSRSSKSARSTTRWRPRPIVSPSK